MIKKMAKMKLTRNQIIGGIVGLIAHITLVHQWDIQTLLTFGTHILDGTAFVLAGMFIGGFFD